MNELAGKSEHLIERTGREIRTSHCNERCQGKSVTDEHLTARTGREIRTSHRTNWWGNPNISLNQLVGKSEHLTVTNRWGNPNISLNELVGKSEHLTVTNAAREIRNIRTSHCNERLPPTEIALIIIEMSRACLTMTVFAFI